MKRWEKLGILIASVASILGGFSWIHSELKGIRSEIHLIDNKLVEVKTVMIMNGHFPKELIVTAKE